MELGNAVFGNSRGESYIDRDRFQDLFCNLMERYGMCDKNEHEPTCYQIELGKIKEKHPEKAYTTYGFYETEAVTDLLKKHNLPKQGCAVHCDCSYEKRWQEFLESRGGYHRVDCEVIQPNFLYKPANLSIMWYKYPLRDSYSNRPFTEEELKEE